MKPALASPFAPRQPPCVPPKLSHPASARHSFYRPIASRLSTNLLFLLLALLAISPVSAVRITFSNCLSDQYRLSNPAPIQWVPEVVEASFDNKHANHRLQVTVWGNVTGKQTNAPLPPLSDPYWQNDNETNGKIVHTTDSPSDSNSLATTLLKKIDFLSYQPWDNKVDFCTQGLANGACPLGPRKPDVKIPEGLPSINLTYDLYSAYAFASLDTTFIIINSDKNPTNIGCVSAVITPDFGGLSWIPTILPIVFLSLTGFAVVFSAIMSPWGSSDIFQWTSNYGRDVDLLRLVTPGFGDCLQYIQFVALTGSLSLDYPGFYQPAASRMAWSTLMFNQSFVANAEPFQSVRDGMYFTNGTYGLQKFTQLVGMAETEDVWAGMMVWLCVCILCVFVLIQAGFLIQWLYRKIRSTPEEDLRSKNIPFSLGNVIRIVFNFFLLPVVALSCFQLVVAGSSPAFAVALSVVTLLLLILFAVYLFYLIIGTRPKSVLFDDLPTVLLYGPLYNTYSDEAAGFALVPVMLTFIRGVAIGAVQPSGIAQVVLLAICEVIQILTIHAFRPFQSQTSMNAYHTIFSSLRLVSILLMVAFFPNLGVSEGQKGWIGYVILGVHAVTLIFGFTLNALQTIVEVVARMLGAGGDDVRGLTRGGLSKIFGARQLSRRVNARSGPSRASQLSSVGMLDEDNGKTGYVMPGGRLRSESGGSLNGMLNHPRQRSSSALDSIDAYSGMPSSYMPGTPGDASTYSFLPSPVAARHHPSASVTDTTDPYYRPPRRRPGAFTDSVHSVDQIPTTAAAAAATTDVATTDAATTAAATTAIAAGAIAAETASRHSQEGPLDPPGEPTDDMGAEVSRGATPAPAAGLSQLDIPPNRPDYATREVDFYYGVRGPALNSEHPGRRLGTGPADPTGPVATATGWFRNLFGNKTKEKGKGFEVVRSSRMPPAMMARNGGEAPPEGIPVAMGVLRNGPIDSDDEDDQPQNKNGRSPQRQERSLLDDNGDPHDSDPESPDPAQLPPAPYRDNPEPVLRQPLRTLSKKPENQHLRRVGTNESDLPEIPRKSSKRASQTFAHRRAPSLNVALPGSSLSFGNRMMESAPSSRQSSLHRQTRSASSRLPFERTASQRRGSLNSSINSSMDFPGDFTQVNLGNVRDDRPASFGTVPHHGISRVDPLHREVDLLGSSAELVDGPPSRPRT